MSAQIDNINNYNNRRGSALCLVGTVFFTFGILWLILSGWSFKFEFSMHSIFPASAASPPPVTIQVPIISTGSSGPTDAIGSKKVLALQIYTIFSSSPGQSADQAVSRFVVLQPGKVAVVPDVPAEQTDYIRYVRRSDERIGLPSTKTVEIHVHSPLEVTSQSVQ